MVCLEILTSLVLLGLVSNAPMVVDSVLIFHNVCLVPQVVLDAIWPEMTPVSSQALLLLDNAKITLTIKPKNASVTAVQ